MTEEVSPVNGVHGVVGIPGDKSISHRFAMLTAIAEGDSEIHNYSTGADCRSTLSCMHALGVSHKFSESEGRRVLTVHGKGISGLTAPAATLDAGNSGSTIRMLSGILAAQPFNTSITGDESLVKRPMRRIMTPLAAMGARIEATSGQFPPITIHGSRLEGIDYSLPVASAQVKSCVLLAGLYAHGETIVREPVTTRDHTEIALRELGADIMMEPRVARIRGGSKLTGKMLVVPGDISSAAFFIVAALITPRQRCDYHQRRPESDPHRAARCSAQYGRGDQTSPYRASERRTHRQSANQKLADQRRYHRRRNYGGAD